MKGLELTRIDFDNMENHDPTYQNRVGIFYDEPHGKTAYSKIEEFLRTYSINNAYIGWNLAVYPKFNIRKIEMK